MNIYFTWSLWWYISLDSVLGSYSMISINYLSLCSAHRHLASLWGTPFVSLSDTHSLWLCLSLSDTHTQTVSRSDTLPLSVSLCLSLRLPQKTSLTVSLSHRQSQQPFTLNVYPYIQWASASIRCTIGHLYTLSTSHRPQHPLMYIPVRHLGNSPVYFVLSF